jgi:hypothetical protein
MGGFFLVWNPWGLFGLVPLIVCTAMGAFVFAARPDRKQNRRLAVFLVTDGIVTFAGPAGASFAGSDATARIIFTVHLAGLFVVVPMMLRFLATIDTPATRPINTRIGAILPWLFAAAEMALFIARPELFIQDLFEPWWGGRMFLQGPVANGAYAISSIAPIYSLIVSISAYRRAAAGTPAKERARRYAIAFGLNDGILLIVTTIVPGIYTAIHGNDLRAIEFLFVWSIPTATTIFVILMAYGILRTQLFDIDLRLAAGVRRGALAAIVLFGFFAAAEIAERMVSEEFGYVIGGFVAAALIVAHKPIERFASGISSAVLPDVSPSPAYVAFRKLEVYEEALEAAYEDGLLSKEDRVILKRLQAKLGVDSSDAARLEEDAHQAAARRTAKPRHHRARN